MNIFAKPLVTAISLYQRLVSPFLPDSCRYYPSCSAYASDAIHKYGAWGGSVRAIKRLARCHPWQHGGHDPVD